jgi:hypothetical protein
MDEIRKIDLSSISRTAVVSDGRSYFKVKESVINIALEYPAALAYLLMSGFDPNSRNAFHKTPLMYAAQINAIEAAKMLLDAGAQTIIPSDTCNYALRTANMSALHYAVRYASKALIKLLIDKKASIYSRVENAHQYPVVIEYPIDWLTRFDNNNLTKNDKTTVAQWLALPSADELANISSTFNLAGEKLYTDKQFKRAEENFKQAIQTNSRNIRALNNYAITALKLGEKDQSLKASYQVINDQESDNKELASAYFNTGLACEGRSYVRFDGKQFCKEDTLAYYLKAYSYYPTESRSRFITVRFNKKDENEFACKAPNAEFEAVYKRNKWTKTFYFLHKNHMPDNYSDVYYRFIQPSFAVEAHDFNLKRTSLVELDEGFSVSTYQQLSL